MTGRRTGWFRRRFQHSVRGERAVPPGTECPRCAYLLSEAEIAGRDSLLCPRCHTRVRSWARAQIVCTRCYYSGPATEVSRGNAIVGCLLLFFFIVPGIIYFAWAATEPVRVPCPRCGSPETVPLHSARGRQIIAARDAGP